MSLLFFIELIIFIYVVYFCIFSILNRLCKCIEHCATAKSKENKYEPVDWNAFTTSEVSADNEEH